MKGVHVKKTLSLQLSAGDWELYTAAYPASCAGAAADMNRVIERAVNSGLSREGVLTYIAPTFSRFDDLGARDSEPMAKLQSILDEVFGEL